MGHGRIIVGGKELSKTVVYSLRLPTANHRYICRDDVPPVYARNCPAETTRRAKTGPGRRRVAATVGQTGSEV